MATTYYTEAYKNDIAPDSNVPAGVVLANGTRYVGVTGDNAQNDLVYMVRIPDNAVLVDVLLSWSAGGSNTAITVGTSAGVDSIFNAITTTAIGAFSLSGGQQGTSAITTGLKSASDLHRGYKFTSADYVTVKFTGSSGWPADGVVGLTVLYYIDCGLDLSYDPG